MEAILSYMHQETGRHFDPRLLDQFIQILPIIMHIKAKWIDKDFLALGTNRHE